jgi:hypothetical protein
LFISTLFPIHTIAGPPFRETRPQLTLKAQLVFNIEIQMIT